MLMAPRESRPAIRTLSDSDVEAVAHRVAQLLREPNATVEAFYTPEALAHRLSVTRRTVYTLLRRGAIRSYKIETAIRIDPRDVDAYLEKRRQETDGGERR
jgi:excisionase family DNA binding protein